MIKIKRLFGTLCLLLSLSSLSAKDGKAEVVHFARNEYDQTAKVEPVKTSKGNCGLVKIKTAFPRSLSFTTGMSGNGRAEKVRIIEADNQVWVWLTPYTKYLNFYSTDNRFPTFSYILPDEIESNRVYNLSLDIVEADLFNGNFVAISCSTPNIEISIDRKEKETFLNGHFQKFLNYGTYDYVVTDITGKYHPEVGRFTIEKDKPTQIDLLMRRACGDVVVNSSPEQGAQIFINNQFAGTTPLALKDIRSGEVKVKAILPMYKTLEQTFTLKDNETAQYDLQLVPTYGEVRIATQDPKAKIYIAREYKGEGAWSGRLNEGAYLIDVSCDNYYPVSKAVRVLAGSQLEMTFEKLVPRIGMLSVMTSEPGMKILIDGIEQGVTPRNLKLLAGNHRLRLTKEGFESIDKDILVVENELLSIRKTSVERDRYPVEIRTESGVEIFQNNVRLGVSWWRGDLPLGDNLLTLVHAETGAKRTVCISVKEHNPKPFVLDLWQKLIVETIPSDASISVEGSGAVIKESYRYLLEPGVYDVTIRKSGYKTVVEQVVIPEAFSNVPKTVRRDLTRSYSGRLRDAYLHPDPLPLVGMYGKVDFAYWRTPSYGVTLGLNFEYLGVYIFYEGNFGKRITPEIAIHDEVRFTGKQTQYSNYWGVGMSYHFKFPISLYAGIGFGSVGSNVQCLGFYGGKETIFYSPFDRTGFLYEGGVMAGFGHFLLSLGLSCQSYSDAFYNVLRPKLGVGFVF